MSRRIAVYCCNHLFGAGIEKILSEDPELNIANVLDPSQIKSLQPDLLIADFKSLQLIALDELFDNGSMLLLLQILDSGGIDEAGVLPFVRKGLVGILPPTTGISEFKKALRSVCSGELWIERRKLKSILSENNLKTNDPIVLTDREIQIFKMVCKGYRNKEITRKLDISEQAVKSHLHRIFRKVGVSDRLQLVLYAMKHYPNYL